MTTIRFNEALRHAAEATVAADLPQDKSVLLIRDVYGRLRFAVNTDKRDYPELARNLLESSAKKLGPVGFGTSA